MKTMKFALIAALVAFTMVSMASTDGFKSKLTAKKYVNTTFQKAMGCPGLVTAMYQQIEENEILNMPDYMFTAYVYFQDNVYRITGTRPQWLKFIKMKGITPININRGPGIG
jgi:hypothetical protein